MSTVRSIAGMGASDAETPGRPHAQDSGRRFKSHGSFRGSSASSRRSDSNDHELIGSTADDPRDAASYQGGQRRSVHPHPSPASMGDAPDAWAGGNAHPLDSPNSELPPTFPGFADDSSHDFIARLNATSGAAGEESPRRGRLRLSASSLDRGGGDPWGPQASRGMDLDSVPAAMTDGSRVHHPAALGSSTSEVPSLLNITPQTPAGGWGVSGPAMPSGGSNLFGPQAIAAVQRRAKRHASGSSWPSHAS